MNIGPLGQLLDMVGAILRELPCYLVWLVGLIFAIVNWHRYPRPALLTTLGFGTMFFSSVFFNCLGSGIFFPLHEDGFNGGIGIQSVNLVRNIVDAIGYGLLVGAIFGWRQVFTPRRFDRRDEPDDRESDRVETTGDSDPRIRTQPKRMND